MASSRVAAPSDAALPGVPPVPSAPPSGAGRPEAAQWPGRQQVPDRLDTHGGDLGGLGDRQELRRRPGCLSIGKQLGHAQRDGLELLVGECDGQIHVSARSYAFDDDLIDPVEPGLGPELLQPQPGHLAHRETAPAVRPAQGAYRGASSKPLARLRFAAATSVAGST